MTPIDWTAAVLGYLTLVFLLWTFFRVGGDS